MASHKDLRRDRVTITAAQVDEIERLLQRALRPLRCTSTLNLPDNDAVDVPRALLIGRADAVFSERMRRTRFLSPAIFGEPAWDMLLAAYIMEGRQLKVGTLGSMVNVAATTALRWVQYLEKERLVVKTPDPDDGRAVDIHLSDHGRGTLDAYFSSFPNGAGPVG